MLKPRKLKLFLTKKYEVIYLIQKANVPLKDLVNLNIDILQWVLDNTSRAVSFINNLHISWADLNYFDLTKIEYFSKNLFQIKDLLKKLRISFKELVILEEAQLECLTKNSLDVAILINELQISLERALQLLDDSIFDRLMNNVFYIKTLAAEFKASTEDIINLLRIEEDLSSWAEKNMVWIRDLIHKQKFIFAELMQLDKKGLYKIIANTYQAGRFVAQEGATPQDLIDLINSGKEAPFLNISFYKIEEFLKDTKKISFKQLVDMAKQLDKPEKLTGLLRNSVEWHIWATREEIYDLELDTLTAKDLEILFFNKNSQDAQIILSRLRNVVSLAPAPRI